MKLYYFDLGGRAQITRIMLRSSGYDFEDVRFSNEEWAKTYKQMSPTGQCPFLECDDGTVLVQSAAIEVFVSALTGYQPSDTLQAARMWMLWECFRDIWDAITPTFSLPEAERADARKPLFAEGGAATRMLAFIEKELAARNTEFAVSDKPTLFDVSLYGHVSFMLTGNLDGINEDSFKKYPKIVELRNKVAAIPAIADVK